MFDCAVAIVIQSFNNGFNVNRLQTTFW